MTNKKNEQTLEQLEKEYADMGKLLQQKRKEEADRKKAEEALKRAELEKVKEARKQEIQDAFKKCDELCKAYIKDYGAFEISLTKGEDGLFPFFKRYFWF